MTARSTDHTIEIAAITDALSTVVWPLCLTHCCTAVCATGTAKQRTAVRPNPRSAHIDEIELSFEYPLIQKKKRSERLILRGCSDMFLHGQVRQELRDLAFAHLIWMTLTVKEDEATYPFNVSLLGADRIMFYPQTPADAVE